MEGPSALAIERETANLRTLRRLSSSQGPGSLPLDPDLPITGMAKGHAWESATSSTSDSAPESLEDDPDNDPSHLFWVPAHLHPELAPAEFRAFLKEHANASSTESSSPQPIARALSGSGSLGRKKSMLSRQYKPSANDGVEDETGEVISRRRTRGSVYSRAGPQLTVADLQKLEMLAEEAAQSDDPAVLRGVLRRSLSMNQASVIDKMDDIGGDNVDEPIIVPPPGQILRRTARTKIRKASLQGDGGGHRFAATRRGKVHAAAPDPFLALEQALSSPTSESDHSEPLAQTFTASPAESEDREGFTWDRPMSYSEESAIYDSYADRRDSESSLPDDDSTSPYASFNQGAIPPILVEPRAQNSENDVPVPISPPAVQPAPVAAQPSLYHPAPQPFLPVPSSTNGPIPARSPSPGSMSESNVDLVPHISPSPSPTGRPRNQKEKKGGLFGKSKWGGEKGDGKIKKDKTKTAEKERDRESREKDTGFFGSLFGGKKKQEEPNTLITGAGPAAAAALLGASKSKSALPSPSESPTPNGGYARYPIHVERAVYRLSHIKLANPRRPLYEQVLISNLMFWYLGIINKPATPPAPSPAAQAAKEEKERQEKERLESERQEKEREKEATRRESGRKVLNKAQSNGSLGGPMSSGRKAEMPVKSPQYGMGMVMEQEAEYHGQGPRRSSQPTSNGPAGYDDYMQESNPSPYPSHSSWSPGSTHPEQHAVRQLQQPYYQDSHPDFEPYEQEPTRKPAQSPPPTNPRSPPRSPSSALPPGAMPPVSNDHSWMGQQQYPTPQSSSYGSRSPSPRSSSSDQSHQQYQYMPQEHSSNSRQRSPSYSGGQSSSKVEVGSKIQGRSLSASAVQPSSTQSRPRSPPSKPDGRSRSRPRDGGSTSPPPPLPSGIRAVPVDKQRIATNKEEEDLPLALYQQQQKQHHHVPHDRDRSYSRR